MRTALIVAICLLLFAQNVNAVSDPRLRPNNKFGINSLSPEAEIPEVASLVNTNGDWGWVVIVINSNDRHLGKWQKVFNMLNANHLIPIVRIATTVDTAGNWRRPDNEDAKQWAQFLNDLRWPTANRYVQIYNEVNRAAEWGGEVDATSYALELEKTIKELKLKNDDFYVLNSPLDLALATSSQSLEAATFFRTMNESVPGIFDKIDGLASHSYPNPDFSASPLKSGRTGIDGYKWELARLKEYTEKDFPVFITETGWRRDESSEANSELKISENYKIAFEQIWSDEQVVMVAPFVFNYTEELFDEFSFKKDDKCLQYCGTISELPKVLGIPARENAAEITVFEHAKMAIVGSAVKIDVQVKNTGNYIWRANDIKAIISAENVKLNSTDWDTEIVYPGETMLGTLDVTVAKQTVTQFTLEIQDSAGLTVKRESTLQGETFMSLVVLSLKNLASRV